MDIVPVSQRRSQTKKELVQKYSGVKFLGEQIGSFIDTDHVQIEAGATINLEKGVQITGKSLIRSNAVITGASRVHQSVVGGKVQNATVLDAESTGMVSDRGVVRDGARNTGVVSDRGEVRNGGRNSGTVSDGGTVSDRAQNSGTVTDRGVVSDGARNSGMVSDEGVVRGDGTYNFGIVSDGGIVCDGAQNSGVVSDGNIVRVSGQMPSGRHSTAMAYNDSGMSGSLIISSDSSLVHVGNIFLNGRRLGPINRYSIPTLSEDDGEDFSPVSQHRGVRVGGETSSNQTIATSVEQGADAIAKLLPPPLAIDADEDFGNDIPEDFIDPITVKIMHQPVLLDGRTYDRTTIQRFIESGLPHPETRRPISRCPPDTLLQATINNWKSEYRRNKVLSNLFSTDNDLGSSAQVILKSGEAVAEAIARLLPPRREVKHTNEDFCEDVPEEFRDPCTKRIMQQVVVTDCGKVYDWMTVAELIKHDMNDPLTGNPIGECGRNFRLQTKIDEWKDKHRRLPMLSEHCIKHSTSSVGSNGDDKYTGFETDVLA